MKFQKETLLNKAFNKILKGVDNDPSEVDYNLFSEMTITRKQSPQSFFNFFGKLSSIEQSKSKFLN